MKKAWNLFSGLLSLAMVGVVLVMLVLMFGAQGEQPQVAQQADTVVATLDTSPPDAYPPPQETVLVPPTGTPTSGAYPAPPTRTSVPTDTPNPNATPQPTVTPFPTRGPAPDPSGTILYVPSDRRTVMGVPIDRQGQKAAEAAPLPLTLDFSPLVGPPSPDGRYLLLARTVEPEGIPYIFEQQTQRLWPMFRAHPKYPHLVGWSIGWHPDSRQVLFWSAYNEELWLVDVETSQYTVLALTQGRVQGAAISPDGQNIVYVDRSGVNEIIWIVSAAGGDARPLFNPVGLSYVFGWSPDGAHILYVDGSGPSPKDAVDSTPIPGGPLWLIDPEGQNRRPLQGHFLFGWGFQPAWSPDGQWIAFTGPEPDQPFGCARKDPEPDPETCMFEGTAIYIENIQTGEIHRLASGIEPVWSPDGSMLAFLSNQSGVPEVWVIRTEGTALQQLTADAQQKWRIVWVPTGR